MGRGFRRTPRDRRCRDVRQASVFVYHYPTAVKAFYMQPVDGRPEVCRSVDLLAPEGYGEITGGSERIFDQALLEERVAQIGLPREAYAWYLDLRRFGTVPTRRVWHRVWSAQSPGFAGCHTSARRFPTLAC